MPHGWITCRHDVPQFVATEVTASRFRQYRILKCSVGNIGRTVTEHFHHILDNAFHSSNDLLKAAHEVESNKARDLLASCATRHPGRSRSGP